MLLETSNLSKRFGNKEALSNVTLEWELGKIYGLLGPNGSGKTTLMKLVAGLLKPNDGTLSLEGDSIGTITKAKVSYMPTENYIYEYMDVKKVKKYFKDFFIDFDETRFSELIQCLDLKETDRVANLSTGQKNRLKLAAALSRKAKLIMLDEPLNGIDLVSREKIISCIVEAANDDVAIVVSSHLVNEIEQILDEVVFIKDGEVILQGSTDLLREEHKQSITNLYKEVYGE